MKFQNMLTFCALKCFLTKQAVSEDQFLENDFHENFHEKPWGNSYKYQ